MRKHSVLNSKLIIHGICMAICLCCCVFTVKMTNGEILHSTQEDISLKKEVDRSVKMAFEFLKKRQNTDGSWSNHEFPALTGLVIYAFLTSPEHRNTIEKPIFLKRGLDFIVKNAKPNGAIYNKGLPNYNTAICIMTLMAANETHYHPYIIKGRRYLISLQDDKGKVGVADQPCDGGVGYGTKDHPDLSNTYIALESIRMTEVLESDQHLQRYIELEKMQKTTLDWKAAITFIQRCQNLPQFNDQIWASDDPKNKGGFIYFPGDSKAGKETLKDGKLALRSYGSMTYAGLLSFIYADLEKNDPRVKTAYEWLCRNYTLDENPGMGKQGLYYYYHTMAKALTAYGNDILVTDENKAINWRKELTIKLVELQQGDGSWVNESGRWWENDPILVTSYALIAMNMVAF